MKRLCLETEPSSPQGKSSYAGFQQSVFYPSSKVTTAPTICVKTSKPVVSSSSQPKPYMPYSSKVILIILLSPFSPLRDQGYHSGHITHSYPLSQVPPFLPLGAPRDGLPHKPPPRCPQRWPPSQAPPGAPRDGLPLQPADDPAAVC